MKRPRKCRQWRKLQTLLDALVGPLRKPWGDSRLRFILWATPPSSPEQFDASSHVVRWACKYMCMLFSSMGLQASVLPTRFPVGFMQLLSG